MPSTTAVTYPGVDLNKGARFRRMHIEIGKAICTVTVVCRI